MSYLLDPKAPEIPTQTMTEHYMAEHKQTEEEAKAQMAHIAKMASRIGLDYDMEGVKVCSTMDAHRLMKFAQDNAGQDIVLDLNFRLFHANFIDNLRLSDRDVLVQIAEAAGLDAQAVRAMLQTTQYADQVKAEAEALAERKDFDYVPFMLFDDGTVLQGVVSPAALKRALA